MTCFISQKLLRKLHENESLRGSSHNSMKLKTDKTPGNCYFSFVNLSSKMRVDFFL